MLTKGRSLVVIPFYLMAISACGDTNGNPTTDKIISTQSQSDTSSQPNDLTKTKLWQGEARGYVLPIGTEGGRIATTIKIGYILSALEIYNDTGNQVSRDAIKDVEILRAIRLKLAETINTDLIDQYRSIQSNFSEKDNQRVIELLTLLSSSKSIEDFTSPGYENRSLRDGVNTSLRQLGVRIGTILDKFYPSRHEYLLASSALIREAGDMVVKSVSSDGQVLDVDQVRKSSSLIRSTRDLNPSRISYCDSQSVPISDHRDAVSELAEELMAKSYGHPNDVTATDVFALAANAQAAEEKFPVKDTEKCK